MKFRWLRELFSFSSKERAGIICLLLIIFLLIVIGKLIPLFIHSDNTNFTKWADEVNSYLENRENANTNRRLAHHVVFDPNKADSISLVNMGVPLKVVDNWMKYIEKGGRFRDKEDVKKIYGMTSGLFEQLDSFMVIQSVKNTGIKVDSYVSRIKSPDELIRDTIFRPNYSKKEKKSVIVLELNSTDSLHLLDISGIGPVLASRIVRYRNLLGGYYAVSQLREVYGIKEENFIAFNQYFAVDRSAIKTININFSTIQEMGRHPYFGYKTARKVLRLRDSTGKFSSPDDLSSVLSADSLNRLIPYLKFRQ